MKNKIKKGFTEELNKFLKLMATFRKDKKFIPTGVYKFKTFEEAEKWRYKMLRGERPAGQQSRSHPKIVARESAKEL
ncbi:MAG: hypothetical protein Q7J59_01175 [Elusimicrobiota bacterium]|nr:hypothetical protein [Elusimicrobiota bacterium]